jgi:predicted enzyme related to lactoylglutathione lyase
MGRVVHFEIPGDDPERAAEFYRGVFGWEISKWDGPVDYWMITTGEDSDPGVNGAIIRRMGGAPGDVQAVNAFINTIQVESIDETERKVPDAGGEQVVARDEIPGVGKVSYFKDTEGNIFGALEPTDMGEAA